MNMGALLLFQLSQLWHISKQVKKEGPGALYAGLSAALARQASYTTLRLGLYDVMKQLVMDCEFLLFPVVRWHKEHGQHLSSCMKESTATLPTALTLFGEAPYAHEAS